MFPGRATDPDDEPMIARWGSEHAASPLVVLLHGNGTSEHSMIEIAPWLPHGPVAYAAVRGPLPAERGFRWFAGTPAAPDRDDLAGSARFVLRWLDGEGDRPVLLLAFRTGVTAAGALLLAAPERFSGAVLLHGALHPGERGALRGIPVFLAHADDDPHTPAELLGATRDWLRRTSGAPVRLARAPGGQLAGAVVGAAGSWLGDRLDQLRAHGETPLPDGPEPVWAGIGRLPDRAGEPPATTDGLPQLPLVSVPDPELWPLVAGLGGPGEASGPPGTLSLHHAGGSAPAYLQGDEFAHVHPDGSLHLCLPPALGYDAVVKGWAVPHPLAGVRGRASGSERASTQRLREAPAERQRGRANRRARARPGAAGRARARRRRRARDGGAGARGGPNGARGVSIEVDRPPGSRWGGSMAFETHPVTPDRIDDFVAVANPNRRATHCWCLSHRLAAKEIPELGGGSREKAFRALCGREHPPGVIGYADGEPVGWCSIGPRTENTRLTRSKLIRPLDGVPVWSIICVVVRSGHRRQGFTTPLIEGAVAWAAECGAPAVESYPVDADGDRIDLTMAFVGTRAMFAHAGFTVAGTTDATGSGRPRIVMRRTIG